MISFLAMRTALRFFSLFVFTGFAFAADHSAMINNLRQKLVGQDVLLRGFYKEDKLDFDEHGVLLSKSASGPWAVYGYIRIRDVRLKEDKLQIEAKRLVIDFDSQGRTITNDYASYVHIRVRGAAETTDTELAAALGRIFLNTSEELADVAPAY